MAYIYFVDGDNGDDTKDGKSLANAWKTLNKATQTMQAGDTTYVKPCTYREYANFANSGADSSPISLIGDINGEYWGIKGSVRITNLQSDESTTDGGHLISMGHKSYITIKNFFLDSCGSTGNCYGIVHIGANAYIENNIFYISPPYSSTYIGLAILFSDSVNPKNITINKNIFILSEYGYNTKDDTAGMFVRAQSASLTDFNLLISNNIFIGDNTAIYIAKLLYPLKIYNNLFLNNHSGIYVYANQNWNNQLYIYNNVFYNCYYMTYGTGSNILSGNNIKWQTINNNLNINANKKFYPLDLSKLVADKILQIQKDGGSTDYKADEDIFENPRPLIGGYDIGPIEFKSEPIQESTIKDSGSYSAKIVKADFKDFTTFLSSGEHTISVKVKWSDYTGANKPQLIIKQDKYCGIDTDQVDTATGDGADWETLSLTITLTKDAEITIRIYARDIGASALTYFDSLNIT